ncbi:ATP-binding cassette domain-containing protein [Saccharopolyspora sp. TS4A08]|uniref:ATP-binding cassette domain-containing protein n=1 Tax=Saccharopolyspora ipomoeae TaxID=3042027 RepID=A0ABT6PPE5_9PSEU|nr:ATP-binding cassette domain-containing protein [Saccharopolyspora sp. TS4A08]
MSFAVPEGRVTALLGESGCGKSMLAAALTGSLPASAQRTGVVLLDGEPVVDQREWRRLRGKTIGFLPQEGVTAFDPGTDVGSQLRALRERHGGWSVEKACAAAQYPAEALSLLPEQHSSGQIQRAALAAAILPIPKLLVVDEPTASLDTATAYAVWESLRTCADAGTAVLAITHDVPKLLDLAIVDHMLFLRDGDLVAAGSPGSLRTLPDLYVQGFFSPLGT